MIFVKTLVYRMIMLSTTTVVALILYVFTAVAFPNLMRSMQTGMDALLSNLELWLEIPAQYMVWAEMADVNSKLVFIAFYIFTFLDLTIGWMLLKRSVRKLGHSLRSRFKRPRKTNVQAT